MFFLKLLIYFSSNSARKLIIVILIQNFGYSCLHFVARSGNLELTKFLVEKGANVNATDYVSYICVRADFSTLYLRLSAALDD